MKILVTGGTGLIGNAIQKIHQEYNHYFCLISSSDCDLLNLTQVKKLFEKERCDENAHKNILTL